MANPQTLEKNIDNKSFIAIDNFYSKASDMEALYLSVCNLRYAINGKPAEDVQNRRNLRLTCDVDQNFFDIINLFGDGRKDIFDKYLPADTYEIYKAYVNLGLTSDYQDIHVDNYDENNGVTLILYCNKTWQDNWGGETFFYSSDKQQVEHVSKFKPGKAVIFNAAIPHMASVQHNYCDNYRFTLAIKFVKRNRLPNTPNPY